MNRRLNQGLLLQALCIGVPAGAPLVLMSAADAADWRLSGSNTLRVDSYHVDGDAAHGPYAKEGLFSFNDLNLRLSGNFSPERSLTVDFAGTLSDSPYRVADQGFVPEVMRVVYEDTGASMPFRLDLGDQNLALSPLTLQRTLKAARLSLRPRSGSAGRHYAVNAFVGTDAPSWRHLDLDEGLYQGLSVDVIDDALGALGVKLVHYSAEDVDQTVASLSARRKLDAAGQNLKVGGEWAFMHGNRRAGADTHSDQGGYLELTGESQTLPLSYRLRYDNYGEHFSPRGSDVIADSEGYLAEAGWRFESGASLNGRLSRLSEWRSSIDPVDTDTAALTVTTPLSTANPARGSLRVETQVQRRRDQNGYVDTQSSSLRVGVDLRHDDGDTTRLDAALARFDDHNAPGRDTQSWQLAASHRMEFQVGGTDVRLTPGVSVSESRGQSGSLTVGPTLALEAERGNQQLALRVGRSEFDGTDGVVDVDQSRVSLSYEQQHGRNHFGVDIDRELREPSEGEQTDAWRVGAYWRHDFDESFGG